MNKLRINFFDFDGTLFLNPVDCLENRELYEKETGIPWIVNKEQSVELSKKFRRPIGIRRGWYGRGETLEPPLVPNPTPKEMFIESTCQQFLESKSCSENVTVILTGRHAGIQKQVLRILHDGNLVKTVRKSNGDHVFADPNIHFLCLGMDGPAVHGAGHKPTDGTLPWKMWIIKKFLMLFPEVLEINIWEDREEHAKEFAALSGSLEQDVNVTLVVS